MKLSQLLAVEKGMKARSFARLTELHRTVSKMPLLSGISRSYQPRQEDGDPLPPESTRVQVSVENTLDQVSKTMTELFDVVFLKDKTNCRALADIVVDDAVLMSDVPVTNLLFLEKQLNDIRTFVNKLPCLDQAEVWSPDENSMRGVYRTEPTQTMRAKKIPRNHVKAEATDKHPAQVEVFYEDVPVGDWTTIKYSGCVPVSRRDALMARVDRLLDAVKSAREVANQTEVDPQPSIGSAVFQYLLAE